MSFMKCIALVLTFTVSVFSLAPRAEGAFTPSEAVALSSAQREGDLEKLRMVLEDKIVRQRLSDLGLSPEEVEARLSALSDGQLHDLALKVDELRIGGFHGLAIFAVVLVAMLAVVLAVMFTPRHYRGVPPPPPGRWYVPPPLPHPWEY